MKDDAMGLQGKAAELGKHAGSPQTEKAKHLKGAGRKQQKSAFQSFEMHDPNS